MKTGLRQFLKYLAPILPPSKGFKHIQCEREGIQQNTQLPKNFQTGERKESQSHSVMSESWQPHGLYSPWDSPGQNTGMGSLSLLHFPNPQIEPRSPGLQADSLRAEPQEKR